MEQENLQNFNDKNYIEWISEIKHKIHKARIKIALSVNTEILKLYWDMGKEIFEKQKDENWEVE